MDELIKCPKCKSEEVGYTGISSGVGNGPVPVVNSHQCSNDPRTKDLENPLTSDLKYLKHCK